eukprot:GEMP01044240.1.p1 GENE.GEMP01044240.1~~GEMP01044240.1.p1  ORF type:complete len:487 (+),score=15.22 GEMP01044240.1:52-1461(+)
MVRFTLAREFCRQVPRIPSWYYRIPHQRFVSTQLHRVVSLGQLPSPTFLPRGGKDDEERIRVLLTKVDEARTPRDKATYQKRVDSRERLDPDGKLRCSKCGVFKTSDCFFASSSGKYGCQAYCKPCCGEWAHNNIGSTLRSTMMQILKSAKGNSFRRSLIPQRFEAGRFEVELDDLLSLWQKQVGRCAYSDLVLSIQRYTPWKLSLERLDNNLGYIPENIVFCCGEFNTSDHSMRAKFRVVRGSSKWSRNKVQMLPYSILQSVPVDDLELEQMGSVTNIEKNKQHRSIKKTNSVHGNLLCTSCGHFKPADDFYFSHTRLSGRQNHCKLCQIRWVQVYENSPVGFFRRILHTAKLSAERRRRIGREVAGEFDLKFDDVSQMYKKQCGLCFYSGVKMNLQPHSDWKCSIERIDNAKGYIPCNVALICSEFQTSVHLSRPNIHVIGTPQWSKKKVTELIEWLESTRSVVCDS